MSGPAEKDGSFAPRAQGSRSGFGTAIFEPMLMKVCSVLWNVSEGACFDAGNRGGVFLWAKPLAESSRRC